MSGITVTVTGASAMGSLCVAVFTNAAGVVGSSGYLATHGSYTPVLTGSLIVWAMITTLGSYDETSSFYTAEANNTIIQDLAFTNYVFYGADVGTEVVCGVSSNNTVASTGYTIGVVPDGSESGPELRGVEIFHISGNVVYDSAASPAPVPANQTSGNRSGGLVSTITTASFNPPAGSYMVAISSANYGGLEYPVISSTPAMSWSNIADATSGDQYGVYLQGATYIAPPIQTPAVPNQCGAVNIINQFAASPAIGTPSLW